MGRRNPPARWVLPTVVNPVGRKCYQIEVPDDPAHIAAFRGALLALASAYNWSDDLAHTAKDVALVWRDIIDNHVEFGCEGGNMQIRECQSGCGIEWSTDGINWTCIDLSGCIETIWDEKLAGAFDDGVLGKYGGQPSPGSAPDTGTCRTVHVVLKANDRWHLPWAINAGDTLTLSNPVGGWTDGTFQWFCYNGQNYALGRCINDIPYYAGDPLHSGNHMAVIAAYNSTTPVYIPLLTGTYSIPAGVVNQDLWFQANDATLSDNAGQIEFDIEVCTGATWCHTWDFTIDDGGWTSCNPPQSAAEWIAGHGWQGADPANTDRVYIRKAFASTYITQVTFYISDVISGSYGAYIGNDESGTQHAVGSTGQAIKVFSYVFNANCTKFTLGAERGGTSIARWGYITRVTVWGTGSSPFGANNC